MLNFLQSAYSWLQGVRPPPAGETFAFQLRLGALNVGTLRAENGQWVFSYSDDFRHQKEITPIADFPILEREYRSETLWPFFALRIPSPKQAAVREFIDRQNGDNVDQGILLREFGERSIANPFRLIPLISAAA